MSASSQVAGFTPSANGFQFVNSWPSEPDIEVNIPILGTVAIGNASNGLCGGMVFAVRDFFEAQLPVVPDTTPPAAQSPLFNYIVDRLFDSFNIPAGVLEYYSWMDTPDHDIGVWLATRHGVAWMTIEQEWPEIQATIDSGHPCPLGVVTVHSADPTLLGHNHQVMAYAYDLDDDGNLTIKVYDPNTSPASADEVQMSLNISDPSHTTPISHNIAIELPVRGFFNVDYDPQDSSALEPPQLPASPEPGPGRDLGPGISQASPHRSIHPAQQPTAAFLQEHTEDHPMAHLHEPGIEVWLEPQLPETVPCGSSSDLK